MVENDLRVLELGIDVQVSILNLISFIMVLIEILIIKLRQIGVVLVLIKKLTDIGRGFSREVFDREVQAEVLLEMLQLPEVRPSHIDGSQTRCSDLIK